MSIFVDTGVFYAHHDTAASRNEAATAALTQVLRSPEYGQVLTSEYVYDEVVTLTYKRTGSIEDGLTVGQRIRGDGYPSAIEMVYSTESLFEEAVTVQETYADHALSFTDAMTVAVVSEYDIDAVLSFDADFDGILTRRDPSTLATTD